MTTVTTFIDVSFVIVSWNVADLLCQCINSIVEYTSGLTYEIIVVDNHSTDQTIPVIQKLYPWVKLVVNWENVGYGRANNQGFDLTQGQYVFILNPDTLIRKDTISELIGVLKENPKIGMVGSRLTYPDGRIQTSCARLLPTLSSIVIHDSLKTYKLPYVGNWFSRKFSTPYSFDISQPVEAISGAAMLIRRNVIMNDVKGFGDKFLHGGEDLDFCFHVRKAGWEIYYCADSVVIHFGGQSSAQVPVRTVVNVVISQQEYFFRCYGTIQGWLYRLIIQCIDAPIMTIVGIMKFLLRRETSQQLIIRLSCVKGILMWHAIQD